jgi:hypothetical protein
MVNGNRFGTRIFHPLRVSTRSDGVMDTVTAFWVRSDIFQHGVLPVRPDSTLSWSSLRHLVHKYQVAREMSREYFKVGFFPSNLPKKINYDMPTVEATFNYTEWKTIAAEDLGFSDIQVEMYHFAFQPPLIFQFLGQIPLLKERKGEEVEENRPLWQ